MKAGSRKRKGRQQDRVRARILLPFALVILFLVAAFWVGAYTYQNRALEADLVDSVNAVERLFRQTLEKDASMMEATLTAIARDENTTNAFRGRDRTALLKRIWPLFDSLRRSSGISHFYFLGPDRKVFLRVHQPDQYGDFIERLTTLRAKEAGEVVRGVELGPLGTFTLRVVLPWYDGDDFIGFLELGEEIDRVTNEIHKILGAEVLVLVDDRYIRVAASDIGKFRPGQREMWQRIGSKVVVGRSMETIPAGIVAAVRDSNPASRRMRHISEADKDLYVAFLPLVDISGQATGEFIVARDVTETWAAFYNSILLITVLAAAAGCVVFAIFYAILGKVERDYRRQRQIELQLSRINSEHQKVVQVEKLSAMGLMVSEIAHQLNNPLVGVVNTAELAEREIKNPEVMKNLLAEIGRAGKDCHSFVQRMLEFTKFSSFDYKPTSLNALILELTSLLNKSFGKQSKILVHLPEVSPTLNVDPVLLRHALFNLMTNAAQANPCGGVITVRLFEEEQDGIPGWWLTVRDEGPGLPAEIMDKIFTPFFTTRAEGTGLGLPVVQHVAILHEGRIACANLEDGGALFALWLPDQDEDEEPSD